MFYEGRIIVRNSKLLDFPLLCGFPELEIYSGKFLRAFCKSAGFNKFISV
jgi:hypothetical protein